MKKKYTLYDFKDSDGSGRVLTYNYPAPFEQNMNEDLLHSYGAFLKCINHIERSIEVVSIYDSGKAKAQFISASDEKKQGLTEIIKNFLDSDHTVIAFINGAHRFAFMKSGARILIYKDYSIRLNTNPKMPYSLSGYFQGAIAPDKIQSALSKDLMGGKPFYWRVWTYPVHDLQQQQKIIESQAKHESHLKYTIDDVDKLLDGTMENELIAMGVYKRHHQCGLKQAADGIALLKKQKQQQ